MYDLATAQATRVLHETFAVGRRVICTRESYWPRTNGDKDSWRSSFAFFCPKCGDIWGRRTILEFPNEWKAEERYCQKHGDGALINWDSIEADQFLNPYYDSVFPEELYFYEFEILNSCTQRDAPGWSG